MTALVSCNAQCNAIIIISSDKGSFGYGKNVTGQHKLKVRAPRQKHGPMPPGPQPAPPRCSTVTLARRWPGPSGLGIYYSLFYYYSVVVTCPYTTRHNSATCGRLSTLAPTALAVEMARKRVCLPALARPSLPGGRRGEGFSSPAAWPGLFVNKYLHFHITYFPCNLLNTVSTPNQRKMARLRLGHPSRCRLAEAAFRD